ncbi:MAG: hypothetical protein ACRDQ7_08280 [Haloechinothrix sp.]
MTAPEVNFSDLSNRPKDTVRKLESSRSRSLRVHRRGVNEEDLVLTTASRAAQVTEVSSAATKLLLALMQHDDRVRTLVTDVVPKVFPWVRFLPKEDVRTFVVELVDALEGADALDNPAPAAQVIAAWRHTAEVHADPELLSILTSDGEDLGAVPESAATV